MKKRPLRPVSTSPDEGGGLLLLWLAVILVLITVTGGV